MDMQVVKGSFGGGQFYGVIDGVPTLAVVRLELVSRDEKKMAFLETNQEDTLLFVNLAQTIRSGFCGTCRRVEVTAEA